MLSDLTDGVDVVRLKELTDLVARITGAAVCILPPDRLVQAELTHLAGPCACCTHGDDPTRAACPLRADPTTGDATRSGTPVILTCPFDVTQFTVPLLDETETVAYLVGKQFPLDEPALAGIETVGIDQPRLKPDQLEASLKLIQMAGKDVTASLRAKGLAPLVLGWPAHKAGSGQLLDVILEAHSAAVGARRNSVLILDRTGQRLLPGASRGLPDSYVNALQAVPVGPEEGACGTAAFTGHACIVADMQTDPRWRRYRPLTDPTDLRSCWSVPIIGRNGQVLGTFATYETEVNHPTVEQLRLSHLYAEYAGIVIENDRLTADLALRAQVARAESELMRAVTASLDPRTVARSATLHMAGRLRFDYCRWEAVAARTAGLDTLYEWSDATAELNWPGLMTATPLGLYRRRTAPEEAVLETIRTRSEQQPPVTVARLALLSGGRIGGVLTLARHGNPFDPEEIRNLEHMGRIAALGLGNALSHQQVRHWASRIEAMAGVVQSLSASLDVAGLTNRAVAAVQRLVPLDAFYLLFFDESATPLARVVAAHPARVPFALGRTVDVRNQEWLSLAASRPYLVIRDTARHRHFRLLRDAGLRSAVIVPLGQGDKPVGMLITGAAAPYRFTKADGVLLAFVGRELVQAVHNARQYEASEQRALTDPLTGLHNRHYFYKTWNLMAKDAIESGASLGVILVDVVNQKGYNEAHGQLEGDRRLQDIAQFLRTVINVDAHLIRYGGDEFVALLPGPDSGRAAELCTCLHQAVEAYNHEHPAGIPLMLSVVGESAAGSAIVDLFQRVDEQLTATREAAVRSQLLELQTVSERDRERFAIQAVLTLAKFEEFKDPYTRGHSERVRWTAREVARRLGMSAAEVQDVEFAAVLHDLGKVVIPDAILKKPGPLTAEEWRIMRQHPEMGAAILSELDVLSNVVAMVRHHQERWDGRTNGPHPGYPDGLAGDAIPLGARILAVVDAYDAMTSDRPYRRSIGEERARAELIGLAGSQFDPAVVKAMLEVVVSLTEGPQKP